MISRFFILSFLLAGFIGCTDSRYTEDSPEIDTFKQLLDAIESGDFSAMSNIYADTAKVYYNSTVGISWRQSEVNYLEALELFENHGYEDGQEFEFVKTSWGEEWVSWWGVWKATVKENGRQIRVPMHISARFEDGKIVEETGYWDNLIIADALISPEG